MKPTSRALLTSPSRSLVGMGIFLIAVVVLLVLIAPRLVEMFLVNPFFNSVILAVLAAGIAVNVRQVIVLAREVDWIEAFRRSAPDRPLASKPRLLAPMARMLAGRERGQAALSAPSMRTILDSVMLRIEESRDLSRYLTGLAIFLGLLGTFWGLLITIRSVADIIATLGIGNDAVSMFGQLKQHLRAPLNGMATSFSTSLFGLASSLVIGFLDLQAGRAQNRFYNELEEWLSSMTRLSSGSLALDGESGVPAYVQALLEQTADGLERMQRAIVDSERDRQGGHQKLGELGDQLARLTDLLTREARERKSADETQDELKTVLRALASQKPDGAQFSDELRAELRLLSRTIAAALDGRRERPAHPSTPR